MRNKNTSELGMFAVGIGFWVFVGLWGYQKIYYLDIPSEAREYCDAIEMVAIYAATSRDWEDISLGEHLRDLRKTVGVELLPDWRIVIEDVFNSDLRSSDQWRNKCLWQFRHSGKTVDDDWGAIFR